MGPNNSKPRPGKDKNAGEGTSSHQNDKKTRSVSPVGKAQSQFTFKKQEAKSMTRAETGY